MSIPTSAGERYRNGRGSDGTSFVECSFTVAAPMGASFRAATVSTYVVKFVPKLAEFEESVAGRGGEFGNDDEFLEFEA